MTQEPEKSVIYKIDPTLQDEMRQSATIIADYFGGIIAADIDVSSQLKKAADALDARDALIADLVDALEKVAAGRFSHSTPPDYVVDPLPSAQHIARAALAKAKASSY